MADCRFRPKLTRLLWMVCLIGLLPVAPASAAWGAQNSTILANAPDPFLRPPFAKKYRVTSYFDHQYPNYAWNDSIVIFNGEQASAIDGIIDRTATFKGGYYLPDTQWYVYYDGHNGYDYGTGAGTTILAAAPGRVVFAGSVRSGCATPLQYVSIDHGNSYFTSYLHLEGIVVREGQKIEAGDPVGISGNSGCSLGAHLHFAVRQGDYYTDPYGWKPADRADPLMDYSGQAANWLWLPDQPPLPVGKITQPARGTRTNGVLDLVFTPDSDSPAVSSVQFWAFYAGEWHHLDSDQDGADGWSMAWDTRAVAEGEVWLHAWAVGGDGRVGKGSPIVTDIQVDRRPPEGFLIGLEPHSVAGNRLWLYAASYDPESTTRQVTFFIRPSDGSQDWREIGDAAWLSGSTWLLVWQPDGVPDGASIDIAARLTDGAGNAMLTEMVNDVTIDRRVVSDGMLNLQSNGLLGNSLNLVFTPIPTDAEVGRVDFDAWYDGGWHPIAADENGSNGWGIAWNLAGIADQGRMRVRTRVYDLQGRANSALAQAINLILDRTPPTGGYSRPVSGGVIRPDVPLLAWASDGGSGMSHIDFYVARPNGWLKIGEDRDARDGWSLQWDAAGIPDGPVDLALEVFDRAGNSAWIANTGNVSLDRQSPVGGFVSPKAGAVLRGQVELLLNVSDAASGLDRAIFYAWYDNRWHHLGFDQTPQDKLSLVWDTGAIGVKSDVKLTAWVYDRAGNVLKIEPMTGLALGQSLPPTATSTPTAIPTETPTAMPTATPTPTIIPTETPTAMPTATPTLIAILTEMPTAMPTATSTAVSVATPTAASTATATPTAAPTPVPLPDPPAVNPAFWYVLGLGAVVSVALLFLALRGERWARKG